MQEGSTAVAIAMVTPGYDQDPASGVADYANLVDQAQFEADKRAVYKHPLFPLLALLFERCEQATQSSDNATSESFNMDIQAFVQHQERDRKPFLTNDAEIDGLMIKAIQVLRIHLLELEKVQELCKDFCNRYITCLKGKMQSENLLRSDYSQGGHGGDMAPSSESNGSSPLQVLSSTGNDVESRANGLRVINTEFPPSDHNGANRHNNNNNNNNYQQFFHQESSPSNSGSSSSSHHNHHHHDHRRSDDPHNPPSPPEVPGSTPLSQIGAHSLSTSVPTDFAGQGSPYSMLSDEEDEGGSGSFSHGSFLDSEPRRKTKRGILPKEATSIMRVWLFQHLDHPYPTEDQKRQLVQDTRLSLLQVNNWFINARRRIIPVLGGAASSESEDEIH